MVANYRGRACFSGEAEHDKSRHSFPKDLRVYFCLFTITPYEKIDRIFWKGIQKMFVSQPIKRFFKRTEIRQCFLSHGYFGKLLIHIDWKADGYFSGFISYDIYPTVFFHHCCLLILLQRYHTNTNRMYHICKKLYHICNFQRKSKYSDSKEVLFLKTAGAWFITFRPRATKHETNLRKNKRTHVPKMFYLIYSVFYLL